jgi:DNA repair photolyase
MTLELEEYQAKKILNVHKHVDGPWFWNKYSAHPYIGCASGCEYCYSRGAHYLGKRDPDTFDTLIQVKTNAVELLRGELFGRDRDVISVGDWQQPAEDRYRLSRGMLEVVRDYEFPLLIVERSPLLTRDLDLLVDIHHKSWVSVVFSISSLDPALKAAFEPRSPGVKERLVAMELLAEAGIPVGTALMPVLPFVGDDDAHLEAVIQATKDHGGAFVLGGGLSMDGVQAHRTLEAYQNLDPALAPQVREMYNWTPDGKPDYSPPKTYTADLGRRVRALSQKHNLSDRLPRYIPPGPLGINKQIAERLFLRTYDLDLEGEKSYRIWAYRKAAWTVDAWPESIQEIYEKKGEEGLRKLPNIGKSLAGQISRWLKDKVNIGEEHR